MTAAKKQKIIVHDNTRVTKTPWKTEKQMEALRRESEKQKEIAAGKNYFRASHLIKCALKIWMIMISSNLNIRLEEFHCGLSGIHWASTDASISNVND